VGVGKLFVAFITRLDLSIVFPSLNLHQSFVSCFDSAYVENLV